MMVSELSGIKIADITGDRVPLNAYDSPITLYINESIKPNRIMNLFFCAKGKQGR